MLKFCYLYFISWQNGSLAGQAEHHPFGIFGSFVILGVK